MPYEPHSFSFEDALARSNDVYEVDFTRWGVRLSPPAPNVAEINFQYPPPGARALSSSVAALAIGPRSTMDRCWVTWDRQKTLNVPFSPAINPETIISSPRILTVDSALLFSQATNVGTLGPAQSWLEAMKAGLTYVFPYGPKPGVDGEASASGNNPQLGTFGTTTILPEMVTSQFGTDLPFHTFEGFFIEEPFLQLLLYAKSPSFSPPAKRAAMLRTSAWELAPNVGSYIASFPIFGRKRVRVQCISHNYTGSPSQIVDFRAGLIRNINEGVGLGISPVFEVNAGTALAVPKDTPIEFKIDNPGADYVTIHIQNGGVGIAGGAITVVAED